MAFKIDSRPFSHSYHGFVATSRHERQFSIVCTLSCLARKVIRVSSPSHPNYCGHKKSRSVRTTYPLHACDHQVWVHRIMSRSKFILGVGQIAPGCFTHATHRSAVFFLFTAYTERVFLPHDRLFKHPLTDSRATCRDCRARNKLMS